MKTICLAPAMVLSLILTACGGGGGGSNPPPPPPTPAPSNLSYPAPPAYTVGIAVAQLSPTVTGTPTGYAIAPAPPAGISLNATTGVISGTPTAAQAATNYTVTASNAGGSTTTTVSITVRDIPPSITYPQATYSFTTELPIAAVTPTATGGAVVSWSIDHALPAGLAFNAASGQITGTPGTASPPSAYVVTATNSGGSDTFDLTIGVQSAIAVDLGHATSVETTNYSGSRILTVDTQKHVVLWNAQSGARILATDSICDATCYTGSLIGSLAGNTAAVRRQNGFDIYSANDGALTAHIDSPAAYGTSWKLSNDGSYLVLNNATQLAVWASNGTSLLTRTGDYSNANFFLAPGEIRLARGPAGANVIETIPITGGASTVSAAFNGGFAAWFTDGERFLTGVGGTVLVYSRLAAQLEIVALPGMAMGGTGDWFWTQGGVPGYELQIYAVGASSTPAATYALGGSSGRVFATTGATLAFQPESSETFSVIDLSGATPVKTDYSPPVSDIWSFAAQSSTDWSFGNGRGVVMGEISGSPLRRFSYGQALRIAGSTTRATVATASGQLLNIDAASRNIENEIAFGASQVALSADGSVLFALAPGLATVPRYDRTLRAFSLPSRTVIADWPANYTQLNTPLPLDFVISASGDVIGQRFQLRNTLASSTFGRSVFHIDGTPIWTGPSTNGFIDSEAPLRLSPSGELIASTAYSGSIAFTTNIFTNGVLSAAAVGAAAGWLDDSRLLMNTYFDFHGFPRYEGAKIVSSAGQQIGTPTIVELKEFQNLGGNLVYSATFNLVIDATTGATVWSTPSPEFETFPAGAVAGNFVFFASGSTVRAEPR